MSRTPATAIRGAEFSHNHLRAREPCNESIAPTLLPRCGPIGENVFHTGARGAEEIIDMPAQFLAPFEMTS